MTKLALVFMFTILSSSLHAFELASVKEQLRVELWQEGLKSLPAEKTEKKASKSKPLKLNEELIRAMVKYQL